MLNKIYNRIKHHLPILICILVTLIVHFRWFNSTEILAYDDWKWHQTSSEIGDFDIPRAWDVTGLGSKNVTNSFYLFIFLAGALAKLGIGFSIAERLLYMVPITFIGPIGAYLLSKYFVKNKWAALLGSFAFSFNTYFVLLQTRHLTIAAAYAIAPLIFYLYLKMLDTPKYKLIVGFIVLSTLQIASDFRIFYILFFILLIYTVLRYFGRSKQAIKNTLKSILMLLSVSILVGLVNAFWTVGIALSGSVKSNTVFQNNLFGNEILNMQTALTIFLPFWNGTKPLWFYIQSIPVYFWIFPVLAIGGVFLGRRKKYILIFTILAIIGILLTKQIDKPLVGLYQWLFSNFPGFNAFREASKFFLITSLGYLILISYFFKKMIFDQNQTIYKLIGYVGLGIYLITLLITVRPYINGDIATLFTPRSVPYEYTSYEKELTNDKSYGRSLFIPITSRWVYKNEQHPVYGGKELLTTFTDFVKQPNAPLEIQLNDFFANPYSHRLISSTNVNRIGISSRDSANDDDFIKNYGNDVNYLNQILDSRSWLTKQDSNALSVYSNEKLEYVRAFNNLSSFDSTTDINEKLSLLNQLSQTTSFNYTTNTSSAITKISQLKSDAQTDAMQQYFIKDQRNNLLTSTSERLNITSEQRKADGQISYDNILDYDKDLSKEYLVSNGSDLTTLTNNLDKAYIGTNSDDLQLFTKNPTDKSKDIINNYSISDKDCNSGSNIDKRNTLDHPREIGVIATRLKVFTGNYCLSTDQDVSKSSYYEFKLNYRVANTNRLSYRVVFNDPKNVTINQHIYVPSGDWRTIDKSIKVPEGATSAKIYIIAYQGLNSTSQGIMDIISTSFNPIQEVYSKPASIVSYVNVSKEVAKNIVNNVQNTNNLVENGSLEKGLWKKKVDDCNNYDYNPIIDQRLMSEGSDGNKSIQLEATNHVACTSPKQIKITNGIKYNFSFDYKSSTNSDASYKVQFDDPAATIYTGTLHTSNKWLSHDMQVVTPIGATTARLTFYAYADTPPTINQKVAYDNISFSPTTTLDNKVYSYTSKQSDSTLPSIKYDRKSRTQTMVSISNAKSPFYIALGESYDTGWSINLNNNINYTEASNNHFKVNSYANGWYIDPRNLCSKNSCKYDKEKGYTFQISLYYKPQKNYIIGVIISIITITALLIAIINQIRKKSKGRDYEKSS